MSPLTLLPVVSFAVLLQEIALTRLFAYLLPYHHTSLSIALAMLGLGLGAAARAAFWRREEAAPAALPAGLAAMAALLPAAAATAIVSAGETAVIAAAFLPFLAAGLVLSACYQWLGPERAARACFRDLCGAAAACLASLPLLDRVGAIGISLWLSGLCAAAAAASLTALRPSRRAQLAALVIAAAALGFQPLEKAASAALAHCALERDKRPQGQREGRVVDWEWSPAGRADLYEEPGIAEVKWIFNDGLSPTFLPAREFPNREAVLRRMINYIPFEVRRPRSAAVIGSGSGIEVLLAKLAGVERIVAVELNGAIIRLVRRWAGFSGPVYDQPDVELHVAEGRRFLAADRRRYDLIQMAFVLTGTQAAGTYAIVEGNLYTLEAYRLYLDRLNFDGLLAVIDESEPRILRQVMTALEVFKERGTPFEEALGRMAVLSIQNPENKVRKYLLLLSPSELPTFLRAHLNRIASQDGYAGLWIPGAAAAMPYSALSVLGAEAFQARFPLNLKPCPDDAPFFYDFVRGTAGRLALMLPTLGIIFLSLGLAGGVGLYARRSAVSSAGARANVLAALLGAAFLMAEIGLLKRLGLASGGPAFILSTLLFSVLVWGAAGARLSEYLSRARGLSLAGVCLAAAAVLAATVVVLRLAAPPYLQWSGAFLFASLAVTLAPASLAMGMPFPTFLSRGFGGPDAVPFLWGINGLGAVAGAAAAQIVSLRWGLDASIWAAAGLYLAAAILGRLAEPAAGQMSSDPV